MKAVAEITSKALVVTSIRQDSKYACWVLSEFKQINFVNRTGSRITVEKNNQVEKKQATLSDF